MARTFPAPPTSTPPFLALPLKCILKVVESLSVRDVENLRLTCRELAASSIQGLFTVTNAGSIERGVLSIRPNINGMSKLVQVSRYPPAAEHIKCVKIFTGDIDSDWLLDSATKRFESGPDATKRHHQLTEFLKVMELTSSTYCNYSTLCAAFAAFVNVDSLIITSKRCPVVQEDILLNKTWSVSLALSSSNSQAYKAVTTIRRYESILLAAAGHLKKHLNTLVVDMLPLHVFPTVGNERNLFDLGIDLDVHECLHLVIPDLFSRIQYLCIALARPNLLRASGEDVQARLSSMLETMSSMHDLRYFDIEFHETYILESMKGWIGSFYSSHWPHLKSLRISGLRSPRALLSGFVLRHSSCLRNLSITQCLDSYEPHHASSMPTDRYGEQNPIVLGLSIKEMLTRFRDNMKLEKFQFILEQNKAALEGLRIYDEDWSRIVSEPSPTDKRWVTVWVEEYVKGKRGWLLEGELLPGMKTDIGKLLM
jgi:hypothetical protein